MYQIVGGARARAGVITEKLVGVRSLTEFVERRGAVERDALHGAVGLLDAEYRRLAAFWRSGGGERCQRGDGELQKLHVCSPCFAAAADGARCKSIRIARAVETALTAFNELRFCTAAAFGACRLCRAQPGQAGSLAEKQGEPIKALT
mmetsp:Transcript_7162/g.21351  ORF Transcript_7162/g.21351 Transcript_7162/m.21351 type:complete len:148 (-) Transcript_7162:733-1176(-)